MEKFDGDHIETIEPSPIYDSYARGLEKNKSEHALMKFLDKNADYYIKKFNTQDLTGKSPTWNWPAFLFSPLWCFYRKQYVLGSIVMLSSIILEKFDFFLNLPQLGISVFIGLMGNRFYRDYVDHHMAVADEMSTEERINYYKRKGGISLIAVFVSFTVAMVLSYMLI